MAGLKNAINIEADLADGYYATGFVMGFTTEMSTDRFIAPVVEFAHSEMAQAFDREIDQVARSNADSLGHVYEWRMVGQPMGRLWKHTLSGRGAARQASWEWQKSIAPILTPQERKSAGNPNDPMTGISDKDIAQLSGRDYFFHWKAPMMEYGMTVNIVAKNAKALFVPSFNADGGFYFTKATHNQLAGNNNGRFTAFWTTWWGDSGAGGEWNNHVKRIIEKDLGRAKNEMGTHRRRKRTFGLSTITDNQKAYESGRNYAEAMIKGKADSYRKASKYVDRYGKFGNEVSYPA